MYLVKFTKQAAKDAKKLKASGLEAKAKELVKIVSDNPFAYPPSFEPLVGSLQGMFSRRINRQHRFVYTVTNGIIEENGRSYDGVIKVLSMWSHYDSL